MCAEVCRDKTQTIVQDKPNEECSLEPQRTCAHVTKLVPKLSPTEECVDVLKEVCTRSKSNPRKVKKLVVKEWCGEESGLYRSLASTGVCPATTTATATTATTASTTTTTATATTATTIRVARASSKL